MGWAAFAALWGCYFGGLGEPPGISSFGGSFSVGMLISRAHCASGEGLARGSLQILKRAFPVAMLLLTSMRQDNFPSAPGFIIPCWNLQKSSRALRMVSAFAIVAQRHSPSGIGETTVGSAQFALDAATKDTQSNVRHPLESHHALNSFHHALLSAQV